MRVKLGHAKFQQSIARETFFKLGVEWREERCTAATSDTALDYVLDSVGSPSTLCAIDTNLLTAADWSFIIGRKWPILNYC